MERLDLVAPMLRHTPEEGFNESAIPGLRLFRQSHPTVEPIPVLYEPSICVVVQGRKHLQIGERALAYDPWNYLISAFTLPIDAEVPEATPEIPFLGFVLRFDPVRVGQLLAEIDHLVEWPRDPSHQAISACPIDPPLARSFARLLGCLDDPLDLEVLADALVRETLYSVLRGPKGFVLRERTLQGGNVRQVGRALTYLEQNFDQPVDIGTLARHAAMSPSALHEHFKRLTALSPMQYVKRLRLHRARALLLGGQPSADAGFEVGYNSPSQFSREFRRLFGVPPTQIRRQPSVDLPVAMV